MNIDTVTARVRDLVVTTSPEMTVDEITDGTPLREVGLSSFMLIKLLIAVQNEFAFTWCDDVDSSVFVSIRSLADYVQAQLQPTKGAQ